MKTIQNYFAHQKYIFRSNPIPVHIADSQPLSCLLRPLSVGVKLSPFIKSVL